MRYTSDLLYRLIRATGTGDPEPAAQALEIPDGLLATISVPGVLAAGLSAPATALRRDSFITEVNRTQPASNVEVQTTVATLTRGLWRLDVNFVHHASFTQGPGNFGGRLRLQDPQGNSGNLAALPNIATVHQVVSLSLIVLLDRDSWLISFAQTATGVGETMWTGVFGLVSRLT